MQNRNDPQTGPSLAFRETNCSEYTHLLVYTLIDTELIIKGLFEGLEDYTTDQRGEVRQKKIPLSLGCPANVFFWMSGRIARAQHLF